MADYIVSDTSLTAVADAIRTKTGKSAQMTFPAEFVDEIGDIGGGWSADDIVTKAVSGDITINTSASIPQSTFNGHTRITSVTIKNSTLLYASAFEGCTNLKAVDYSQAGIGLFNRGNVFKNCTKLDTLILRSETFGRMVYNNCLSGTAFASGGAGGTIYIPKVLYDELGTGSANDYKAATNWSTYDEYGTITWAQIEGSQYETAYADGTPIPTT